ncbi:ribonuclease T [Siculibacillus lacustris]|uniref:Ribonuclease T n=1 Tax=Siculibacillus lacustris TaxID=1549641 RepID=A0A4Q9VIB3_9HYPH|nr:ribonuclease T2 [Siculibacillus lacustris]TBW34716.1 ribonuclease T [Siculibacillus lacustris]
MPRAPWRLAAVVLGLVLALASALPAAAQGRGRAGDFDFWVLSLSWSPSYCEATGNARHDAQCARPFAFVVHGLWPQYERGFPGACDAVVPPPGPDLVRSMLDVMPSPGLIRHEWDKHGTCSGLKAESYFTVIRRLFEKIRIPADYAVADRPRTVAPSEVERAFIAANRGLDPAEISVLCDGRRLQEVRFCLKKDLSAFRACPEVERRSCRLERVYLPAVRGGN